MSRVWRSLPAAGIAAVGLYVTIVACKDDGGTGGSDGNAELQVLAGIANPPVTGYVVRVNTPGGEFNAPLGAGDQTNPDNWTTFDLPLEEGEMLVISVMDGENPLVIGECTVQGATELHYARAIAFYFAPPNNHINCATGLFPAP
jgi:hypothetical protein